MIIRKYFGQIRRIIVEFRYSLDEFSIRIDSNTMFIRKSDKLLCVFEAFKRFEVIVHVSQVNQVLFMKTVDLLRGLFGWPVSWRIYLIDNVEHLPRHSCDISFQLEWPVFEVHESSSTIRRTYD